MGDFGVERCEEKIVQLGEATNLMRGLIKDPTRRADVREILSDLVSIAGERIRQLGALREARIKRMGSSIVR